MSLYGLQQTSRLWILTDPQPGVFDVIEQVRYRFPLRKKGGNDMRYFIRIKGQEIPVTEPVYRLYCQGERKERYFRESDYHNKVFFYDALDTDEMNGCELMADRCRRTVEEEVELRLETERLKHAITGLEEPEKELIRRIYAYGRSLREISREDGIPVTTLHYRHQKILGKLKTIMRQFRRNE